MKHFLVAALCVSVFCAANAQDKSKAQPATPSPNAQHGQEMKTQNMKKRDAKKDAELCTRLREHVGDDIPLMYDGSAGFDLMDANHINAKCGGDAVLHLHNPGTTPANFLCDQF